MVENNIGNQKQNNKKSGFNILGMIVFIFAVSAGGFIAKNYINPKINGSVNQMANDLAVKKDATEQAQSVADQNADSQKIIAALSPKLPLKINASVTMTNAEAFGPEVKLKYKITDSTINSANFKDYWDRNLKSEYCNNPVITETSKVSLEYELANGIPQSVYPHKSDCK